MAEIVTILVPLIFGMTIGIIIGFTLGAFWVR